MGHYTRAWPAYLSRASSADPSASSARPLTPLAAVTIQDFLILICFKKTADARLAWISPNWPPSASEPLPGPGLCGWISRRGSPGLADHFWSRRGEPLLALFTYVLHGRQATWSPGRNAFRTGLLLVHRFWRFKTSDSDPFSAPVRKRLERDHFQYDNDGSDENSTDGLFLAVLPMLRWDS